MKRLSLKYVEWEDVKTIRSFTKYHFQPVRFVALNLLVIATLLKFHADEVDGDNDSGGDILHY